MMEQLKQLYDTVSYNTYKFYEALPDATYPALEDNEIIPSEEVKKIVLERLKNNEKYEYDLLKKMMTNVEYKDFPELLKTKNNLKILEQSLCETIESYEFRSQMCNNIINMLSEESREFTNINLLLIMQTIKPAFEQLIINE